MVFTFALLHNKGKMHKVEVNMEYRGKDIGLRIKALRRQKHMTQFQLAEKLCYATERQVQRIENGEIMCPTDRLAELALILDTSTDYLLFGKRTDWLPETPGEKVRMVMVVILNSSCKD